MRQIGLFFGSFNPFHIGHLLCITDAYNRGLVDMVYVIPAWQNPWKEHTGNYDVRCCICSAMIQDIPFASVSCIEKELKPQYTYQVLEEILHDCPENNYSIIGGTDIANEISKWKNGNWIMDNFCLIKVDRLGFTDNKKNGIKISSTDIRDMIKTGLCPIPYINNLTYQIIKDNKIYD